MKLPDIPPAVARAFLQDMRAFFAAETELKRDEIAARQRHILLEHMPPKSRLRISEVRELFQRMHDND